MLRNLLQRPSWLATLRVPSRKTICMCLSACGFALLVSLTAHAQGGVPLVTVATDQSSLNLSTQFGVPAATAINQAGDFAFIGTGNSGLFFRAAGAASATLLLQNGDAVPGFPGSSIVSFSSRVGLNSKKSILFGVSYTLPDGLTHVAVLTYDGANYNKIASSDDIAPAPDGVIYGTTLTPGSINDNGDVNFSAIPVGKLATTFYILPSGSATAVRVAALNDTPPAACTWCVNPGSSIGGFLSGSPSSSVVLLAGATSVPPLNASGQMSISFAGGTFIGSKDGLQLVMMPSSGPCSPSPSLAASVLPLNEAGAVVFTNEASSQGAICISASAGTPMMPMVTTGDPTPAAIGGTYVSFLALALDDAGDILYRAEISGGNTPFALLRLHQSNGVGGQIDVVAYNGETLPAPDGSTFASPSATSITTPVTTIPIPSFTAVSMASNGSVSFKVLLSQGAVAIYTQSGTLIPVRLAIDGQSAPSSGGGSFELASSLAIVMLDNGSTSFASIIARGTANYGQYLGTPSGFQALMTTADPLPTNARMTLWQAPPSMAGQFVAFMAQLAGSGRSLLIYNHSKGNVTTVVRDADLPIQSFSPLFGAPTVSTNFFVNEKGQVAYEIVGGNALTVVGIGSVVFISGTAQNPVWSGLNQMSCGTIYLWTSATAIAKVVAPGDLGPFTGTTFSCAWLSAGPLSPLNNSGQLAFKGILSPTTPPTTGTTLSLISGTGVYEYSPGGAISQLVAANAPLSSASGSLVSLIPNLSIPMNSAGQVAFGAQFGIPGFLTGTPSFPISVYPVSTPSFQGFFLEAAGNTPSSVAGTGNAVPGASATFSDLHFISGLNDNGVLAFTSGTSASADGIFLAPSGGAIQTIAQDGSPAPGGGAFSLMAPVTTGGVATTTFTDLAQMNNESDVAFRAGIIGGAGDSGYYRALASSSGTPQPAVLQGQAVPGGLLNTIPTPGTQGANFALGPDGSLAFVNGFTSGTSALQGMFVAQPNGTILKVLATGDTAPGGGTVNSLSLSQGLAAGGAGQFAFWAGIQGGTARQAIFMTAIPPGVAISATTVASTLNPGTAGQQTTLSASVNSTASGTPSGSVTFFDGGVALGSGAVNASGQATLNTSSLSAGAHTITAQYSGDANFASSNSSALTETVIGFAAPPANLAVTAGQSLPISLTLFGAPGSNLAFTLSCSGLPANSSCQFATNPVSPGAPPNGSTVLVTFSTAANAKSVPAEPRHRPWPLGMLWLSAIMSAVLAAGALWLQRLPQPRFAFGMCFLVLVCAMAMTSCGSAVSAPSIPPGTPAGLATFTITAASSSGAITVNTVVHVTVQ